ALISLAVLLVYGALIATLGSVGGPAVSENAAVEFVLLAVLFVTVPSISWTRRLAFAAVDRALYREYVDYTELSRTLSVCAARATDMEDLASAVLGKIARELRLSFASFLGVSDGRVSVRACMGDEPPGFIAAIESRRLEANSHSATLSRLTLPYPTGEAVLVSLPRGESDAWILCLGPKVTEEPFQREDLELAQSIASHVATIVEKLELLDELKTKAIELTELNRRLVHTQETERSRIASYLHDEPLQQIASLVWRYSGKGLPPELEQELQSIAEELRDFTARLHPRLLEDLGLVRALEWLCARAGEESDGFGKPVMRFEIGFDFDGIGRDDRLDPNVELALYRIAQEALTNCQRHSSARSVRVSLRVVEGEVALAVEDDGVGFSSYRNGKPVVSLPNPSGRKLGLIGMRERAEQAGGLLTISGREPSGTRVAASIPISARHSTPLSTRAQKDFVQAG
ncbi:MAG: sensor histidine kinase, partial [Chloroflexi bacterium]|nr:sensor histidine kinase [Chloroflexota bacterium]